MNNLRYANYKRVTTLYNKKKPDLKDPALTK